MTRDHRDRPIFVYGERGRPVPGNSGPRPLHARLLRTEDDAEVYVASVCFKHGPPRLAGVELEWLVHQAAAPAAPLDPAVLRTALGPHAPPSLDPASPARALPGGSTVTVEPGGQVELASPPLAPFGALVRTVAADAEHLHERLDAHGFAVSPFAADPLRPPRRVLDLPRYRAMEHRFDRVGPWGRSGMCSTAAVQVCVDAGEGAEVAHRWAAVHALGPVLVAAFANSPVLHGRRTGWKSSRLAAWLALDPQRTAPPPPMPGDPAAAWARRVLDTELLCVRRARRRWDAPPGVTFADWISGQRRPARPADDRGPRLPHLHPVSPGPAARAPRGPLPRRPAGPPVGAAGGRAGRRAVRRRDDGPCAGGVRTRSRPVGVGCPARARRPGAAARRGHGVRAGAGRAAAGWTHRRGWPRTWP